ncbi:MAG: DNA/RNA nuclease SfsA [Alphaproteobacteria bacterium]|nr:DNA/RNA nuclease SfsA [Alphaproteobacteria bacterium]
MKFSPPLARGRLVRRYKRFLADVTLATGETITAHVANPGAMTGLADPGLEIWLSKSDNPKRKLAWSWELARVGRYLVGINAGLPNRLVEEALGLGIIPELAGYAGLRREVRYGTNSRVDFVLSDGSREDCYVEVKNVHLKRGPLAAFPDSVTARGTRHLQELARMAAAGCRAVMLYVVQRADCNAFTIAGDIDPAYAEALALARRRGVELLCYTCTIRTTGIRLVKPLRITI